MFVLSKWQRVTLPTCWPAWVRSHFYTVITPSWITQQISIENCAHRGASAHQERQTKFKIVTWTKQTWTKQHNTACTGISRLGWKIFGHSGQERSTRNFWDYQFEAGLEETEHIIRCLKICSNQNAHVHTDDQTSWQWVSSHKNGQRLSFHKNGQSVSSHKNGQRVSSLKNGQWVSSHNNGQWVPSHKIGQ